MGVATFMSNITSEGPLTWSVESSTIPDGQNKSETDYQKLFYLSTPPSLNLSTIEDFSGCGIALLGITGALQNNSIEEAGPGTSCDAVMGLQCRHDIVTAALETLNLTLAPENLQRNSYRVSMLDAMCGDIANSIGRQLIPSSCSFAGHLDYGISSGSRKYSDTVSILVPKIH